MTKSIKRVWVLLAGAGAGLYPLLSCALGLGEVQIESQLNQPLRARVDGWATRACELAAELRRLGGDEA